MNVQGGMSRNECPRRNILRIDCMMYECSWRNAQEGVNVKGQMSRNECPERCTTRNLNVEYLMRGCPVCECSEFREECSDTNVQLGASSVGYKIQEETPWSRVRGRNLQFLDHSPCKERSGSTCVLWSGMCCLQNVQGRKIQGLNVKRSKSAGGGGGGGGPWGGTRGSWYVYVGHTVGGRTSKDQQLIAYQRGMLLLLLFV